jgi:glycosyltransferase involved in cell wall biosynthesis
MSSNGHAENGDGRNGSRTSAVPILFVHHRSELGGAPASLSYLIAGIDRDRFEPHVYSPPGPAAELFREAGAIVHTGPVAGFTHIWASTYSGRRWLLFARELARLPSHVAAFRRVLRRHPFALVHMNDSPLVAAAWLARRAGMPVVWHLRSALPQGGTDRRSRVVRRLIRRLGTASIAINRDVADLFGVDSDVVPNSVDLERFRPGDARAAKDELGLPLDRPVVAYFGFLYPSKGFREFLEAAARISARGHDATFLVVGGAVRGEMFFATPLGRVLRLADLARDYEREAKRMVSRLELDSRVRFIPFTQQIERIYRACDIVVAPSRGPEIARPVIEAAASGVPVVASGTRTGGGIVLAGETGVLVDDVGVEPLTDAIVDLLESPARRQLLGQAARRHAEATFDERRNARLIEQIYDRMLPKPRERTRILFVHHRPQLGGAPLSLAFLIRYLDPRFEAHVFCPRGPAAQLFEEAGAVVHTGTISQFVHVWDAYRGLRWSLLAREVLLLPKHLRELRAVLREGDFDIVHLNESTLLPAAWLARRMGLKVVWHLRTALVNEGLDRRSRFVTWMIEYTADRVVAIDHDVASRFRLRRSVEVIPNSADIKPAEPQPSREAKAALGLNPDVPAIGFFGFIRRQKGWPEFVQAAQELIERGVTVQFVVMGGGVRAPDFFRTWRGKLLAYFGLLADEESAFREFVARMGLTSHFRFVPFTTQTRDVYRALDLVVFPNQEVGLGRPVIEAAANARPVVASGSSSGADVLVPGKTGLLVEREDPRALASAIERLLHDPPLRRRMGNAAHKLAQQRFSPAENAHAVEAVYDSIQPPLHSARVLDREIVQSS